MILGGNQPWTRRVIGVSTCPQVGSMFNEGIWNTQTKTWEGSAIPRTMEGDEAHYTAFLLGTPSLQDAGCGMLRILKLPRAWFVLCILHLAMAMGRLLGEFVDREARGHPFAPSRPASLPIGEACRLERLRGSFPGWGRNGQFF